MILEQGKSYFISEKKNPVYLKQIKVLRVHTCPTIYDILYASSGKKDWIMGIDFHRNYNVVCEFPYKITEPINVQINGIVLNKDQYEVVGNNVIINDSKYKFDTPCPHFWKNQVDEDNIKYDNWHEQMRLKYTKENNLEHYELIMREKEFTDVAAEIGFTLSEKHKSKLRQALHSLIFGKKKEGVEKNNRYDVITFEQSKKLKEFGLTQESENIYDSSGHLWTRDIIKQHGYPSYGYYAAYTLKELMDFDEKTTIKNRTAKIDTINSLGAKLSAMILIDLIEKHKIGTLDLNHSYATRKK